MKLVLQRIGDGYGVLLPPEILRDLGIAEGSFIEAAKVGDAYQITGAVGDDDVFPDAMKAYHATKARHDPTYRALAQ